MVTQEESSQQVFRRQNSHNSDGTVEESSHTDSGDDAGMLATMPRSFAQSHSAVTILFADIVGEFGVSGLRLPQCSPRFFNSKLCIGQLKMR